MIWQNVSLLCRFTRNTCNKSYISERWAHILLQNDMDVWGMLAMCLNFFYIFLLVAVVAVIGLCVLVSSVLLVSLILCQRKRTRRRKNKKNGRLTGEGRTAVPALRYLVSRLNSLIDTWRAILCFKHSSVVIGTGHQHEETELQLQGLSTRGNIADFWSTISYT